MILAGVAGNNITSGLMPFIPGLKFGLEPTPDPEPDPEPTAEFEFEAAVTWSGGAGGGIPRSNSTGEGVSATAASIIDIPVPVPMLAVDGVPVTLELPFPIVWGGNVNDIAPLSPGPQLDVFVLACARVILPILDRCPRIKGVLLTDFEPRYDLLWDDVPEPEDTAEAELAPAPA